jgi:hypothetical protein
MRIAVGNEFRNLVRALERQDRHSEKIERRHKRRGVSQEPKHAANTAPRRK